MIASWQFVIEIGLDSNLSLVFSPLSFHFGCSRRDRTAAGRIIPAKKRPTLQSLGARNAECQSGVPPRASGDGHTIIRDGPVHLSSLMDASSSARLSGCHTHDVCAVGRRPRL